MTTTAPQTLAEHHRLEDFDSGVSSLDDWLRRRAQANQASGASRTFVACVGDAVVGYYSLATGAIATTLASGRFRRNMPSPIPVVLLARLAVDRRCQHMGIGSGLFRDAARRVNEAADLIGIRGLVVHAISEQARSFYIQLGFDPSPMDAMTLMITLADLRAALD